jgi:plasmid stabilization system protein ParE
VNGYRLLPPAEEEMTEAALFYEAANAGLGDDFLDDIQHAIDTIRERPELGPMVASGFRRMLIRRASSTQSSRGRWWSWQWLTSDASPGIGKGANDC